MDFSDLYECAISVLNPRRLGEFVTAGYVGAALQTASGKIFTGANVDAACGIGFCAEHSAIAAMLTAGECRVTAIIAVGEDGVVMPPCGRCREFISQLHRDNAAAVVALPNGAEHTIAELLPFDWK